MHIQNKHWINKFFILSIFFILIIGLFNYVVDPYGIYRVVEIKGFNQQKEGVRGNVRYVKALEVSLRRPKTIIMGSSRVHDCINPNNAIFDNYKPIYNYGLDMARIKELKMYLEHAIINSDIETLVLGLDYFMFNKYERLNYTLDTELIPRKITPLDIYIKPLFTSSSLSNSLRTIKFSRSYRNRKEFLANGYRPGRHVFYGLKSYEKLHKSTNWIFLTSITKLTLYYSKMLTDREAFNDFEDILKICKKNNIVCKFYISPAHADLDGEGILAAGLYDNFEDWKREITNISYKYSVPLFDFSGYNKITTEKVETPMDNYWDSSHFTEKVGDLILNKIFNRVDGIEDSFGVQICPDNIEEHLKQIRLDQKDYQEKNSSKIIRLQDMYERALNGKKQDKLSLQGIF